MEQKKLCNSGVHIRNECFRDTPSLSGRRFTHFVVLPFPTLKTEVGQVVIPKRIRISIPLVRRKFLPRYIGINKTVLIASVGRHHCLEDKFQSWSLKKDF